MESEFVKKAVDISADDRARLARECDAALAAVEVTTTAHRFSLTSPGVQAAAEHVLAAVGLPAHKPRFWHIVRANDGSRNMVFKDIGHGNDTFVCVLFW
jgi:hypothetical protein